ncbi:MAG: T9SS type A sorting domain-containing protein [Paludibacteraceae bacterium]|nr:T9SS type A sorting domain-containing protein [Paludibacteraceae bacterium]
MKNFLYSSIFFVCLQLCIATLNAQVVVVPAGGDGDNFSFSVGQAVVGVASGETGSAEIGVQQSYTLTVLGIEQTPAMTGTSVKVYPNPTASMLRIDVVTNESAEVEYMLYTDHGQLLESKHFDPAMPIDIDMTDYPTGTYILRLTQNGQVGAGYQVIKK